jgi:hypothetical protein
LLLVCLIAAASEGASGLALASLQQLQQGALLRMVNFIEFSVKNFTLAQ